MVQLQQQAQSLGYSLSIADIEDSSWVAARALIAELAEEAADYADDVSETYGEPVRFSDLDRLP
jgi:hypothetical protein